MMHILRKLASLRLTLVGMAALAVVTLAAAGDDGIDTGFAMLPISVLVLNLLAAIAGNRSFRTQTGLLVFHVGLLLVFLLAGLTVLTRFDGHVEVTQGGNLDPRSVVVSEQGWLHRGKLDQVRFTQGAIVVDYLPRLLRQNTRSTLVYTDADGRAVSTTIGDGDTLTLAGYRIAATFNKGFAVILGWHGTDGRTGYGAIHFPSYPENDWKQLIDWTTPAGETLSLELELGEPPLRADESWTLGRTDIPFNVRVASREGRVLAVGQSVVVEGGRVSLRDLRLWMGYRIDYLPLLPWALAAALLAVGGLVLHYWSHYLRPGRSPARARVAEGDALDVAAA